jgi:hypothetical protein
VEELKRALVEALDRQTATAEVLRVINFVIKGRRTRLPILARAAPRPAACVHTDAALALAGNSDVQIS